MKTYTGISANAGVTIGPAYHFNRSLIVADDRVLFTPEDVEEELTSFDTALAGSKTELLRIMTLAEQKAGASSAGIFEAQMMMIDDAFILESIRHRIRSERKSAAFIVDTEFSHHQHFLQISESPLLRERADDVEDVKQRILQRLVKSEKLVARLDHPAVVVAEMLTPADAVLFSRHELLGFAIDGAGMTSHVSILARSLDLPAIVGLRNASSYIETDDIVILDADNGRLIVAPDDAAVEHYKDIIERSRKTRATVVSDKGITARPHTSDGKNVIVSMNMELIGEEAIAEADRASRWKGKVLRGLGLVRTEHFLTTNDEIPSEEEQTKTYRDLADRFHPAPITIRTFDFGGDKFIGGGFREKNPFLGWRGIRISLDEPETFKTQVRAILRASAKKNIRLLLPMLTNVEELDHALALLEKCKDELRINGEEFDDKTPVGVMVEVPSAALMADGFAERCDFLSIGSNDLTQYTLAVDRGNDFIARMFDELHPAVLRLMEMTIKAAHRRKKKVSLCGEMGAKNIALPIVIGLGIDEVSVSPVRLPKVIGLIKKLDSKRTHALAKKAVTESATAADVKQLIYRHLKRYDLIEDFLKPEEIAQLQS